MPLRSDWSEATCPIARSLDVVGDPWVLLVLREALTGATRFEQFRYALGVRRQRAEPAARGDGGGRAARARAVRRRRTAPARSTSSPTPARDLLPGACTRWRSGGSGTGPPRTGRLDVVHEGCGAGHRQRRHLHGVRRAAARRHRLVAPARATRTRARAAGPLTHYLSSAPEKRLRGAGPPGTPAARRPFYPVADPYDGRAVPLGLPDRGPPASKEETTHAEQQPCLPQVGGLQRPSRRPAG